MMTEKDTLKLMDQAYDLLRRASRNADNDSLRENLNDVTYQLSEVIDSVVNTQIAAGNMDDDGIWTV